MVEDFKELMKSNKLARAVLIAALLGVVFSFVYWWIGESGSGFELVGPFMWLDKLSLGGAFYELSKGRFDYAAESLISTSFFLLVSLFFAAIKAAPFIALVASVIEKNRKSSKHWIVASLVAWAASYALALFLPMIFVVEREYSIVEPPVFLLIVATLIAFFSCLLLIDEERACALALAALAVIACILAITKTAPFGSSSFVVLSNLIQYCAFWTACAGAIRLSKCIPVEDGQSVFKGLFRKKREPVPSRGQSVDTSDFLKDAESVKQLKALCDEGAITQEEFDRKKKQIIGL